MVDGIGQSLTRAQENGMRSVSDASATLNARLEDMFTNFDNRRQDMDEHAQAALQRFRAEAERMLGSLTDQVGSLVDLVDRERHAMRNTIDTLAGQTERSIQGMQIGAEKMRSAAERFDTAGTSVHTLLQSSTETVSGLRSGASEIAVSMRELSAVVAEYRSNRDATAQNVLMLQSLVESAQQEAALRHEAVDDLIRLSDKIHSMNAETEEFLGKVGEVMGSSFESFQDGVGRALNKTIAAVDTSLSSAVESLSGGVEQIGDRLDEISAELGMTRRGRV
jgi:DNA anti-recombination protein RmuC